MALFIGFAPLFILSLLFKKTAPLFQKWLFYGLATIFSSVLLGVMSEIATDLVTNVAGSLFVADKLLTFVGGAGVNGIMEASTQQLGLGLILSTLLITVPPMAGMWFNGLMSSAYYGTNYLGGWNGGAQPMPGSGAGSGAHAQVENRVAEARQNMKEHIVASNQVGNSYNQLPAHIPASNSTLARNSSTDIIRTESQIGNATQPIVASNIKHQGGSDKMKTDKGENV